MLKLLLLFRIHFCHYCRHHVLHKHLFFLIH
nr:MAG TPA: 50S ribosomal protein L2 [Caudoviricetes sp.]DAH46802.1 MAG TPA: 50S ribosomal protein L2 [Caudoviricetes sp.]DAH85796.1 MAG TPA: 50S ribosomal protein L2 [Bacteriophage sp.]DAT75563.1 MAG TPA: 50S ribosomal protein L2 [Crassvirales sp.]